MKKTGIKLISIFAALVLMTAALAPSAAALGDMIGNLGGLLGDDFTEILNDWLMNSNGRTGMTLGDIFANPNGILDALRERLADMNITISNSDLASAIVSMLRGTDTSDLEDLLNSNDFVNMLAEFLEDNNLGQIEENEPTTARQYNNPQGGNNNNNYPTDNNGGYNYIDPYDYEDYYNSYEGNTYTDVYNYYQNNGITPATTVPPAATVPGTTAVPSAAYTYEGAQAYTQTTAPQATAAPSYVYVQQGAAYDPMTTVGFAPVYTDDASTETGSSTLKVVMGVALILLSAGAIVGVVLVLRKTKA